MKALKRFYGKSGRWYDVGDEIHDEDKKKAPKSFVSEDKNIKTQPIDKVAAKITTKRKRVKAEDKNGKPKTNNK